MSTLEKAVTQEHITEDTVDFQFCSDWLKSEIKLLFKERDELQYRLKITEGQRDNESGVLEVVAEERNMLRTVLQQIEQDTRNSSVVGHLGITCMECKTTNEKAREALE